MIQGKEHFMKPIQLLILVLVAIFAGCATATPPELINARTAYHQASMGPAAKLTPAELHKAHEALVLAEQSFKENSDSYKTLDLAYVAQRKSELAGALGVMAADKARTAKADATFQKEQTEIVAQGKQDLSDAEQRAADAAADAVVAAAAEKARRDLSDSEKRTAAALAELAKLAAVKEEERGLVVTLSGSVLFQSAQSNLLSSAQVKLDQVVKALLAVRERNLIVEGHTDSQGSDSYNQDLSQRRADSVRNYLAQGGYPADRIQAHGMGESSPIADNASAEGRANNRRVEIVIERESQASNR
ncbi:MAG: DUF4398 domain-containing protein [Myxococcales bacterium]|nr:MAG: DUF4398 domain-containing protein [Myxococcales bacterium]